MQNSVIVSIVLSMFSVADAPKIIPGRLFVRESMQNGHRGAVLNVNVFVDNETMHVCVLRDSPCQAV